MTVRKLCGLLSLHDRPVRDELLHPVLPRGVVYLVQVLAAFNSFSLIAVKSPKSRSTLIRFQVLLSLIHGPSTRIRKRDSDA